MPHDARSTIGFCCNLTRSPHRQGSQGQLDTASRSTLENEFGTKDEDKILAMILEKGDVQETAVNRTPLTSSGCMSDLTAIVISHEPLLTKYYHRIRSALAQPTTRRAPAGLETRSTAGLNAGGGTCMTRMSSVPSSGSTSAIWALSKIGHLTRGASGPAEDVQRTPKCRRLDAELTIEGSCLQYYHSPVGLATRAYLVPEVA